MGGGPESFEPQEAWDIGCALVKSLEGWRVTDMMGRDTGQAQLCFAKTWIWLQRMTVAAAAACGMTTCGRSRAVDFLSGGGNFKWN